ncbi:hypothetical protein K2173_016456 [Erythroxylum novogranatense]|uniref:Uncharacterized protein n=1 Tax=Erythroxylum novogranatense TaxID=1862640 RepID=A0AAV8SH61_9ROSI|nr:hypothetical protein K2173_016456 [Erythroxylum novogranatense]
MTDTRGSKEIAGSVASDTGEASAEEADNLLRSSKKVKRTYEFHNVTTGRDVEMGTRDESMRKGSYRHSVTGFDSRLSLSGEALPEVVSEEDSNIEEADDPECPTAHITTTDKLRIRCVWANTLIVKMSGRRIGYRFLVVSEETMETAV